MQLALLIISLKINHKSYYFVYLQAPNILFPLISLLFCSQSIICSSFSPNSDPNSGPHFFHEAPQVPCFIFLLLPLQVYYQYCSFAVAAHLVRSHVSSRTAFIVTHLAQDCVSPGPVPRGQRADPIFSRPQSREHVTLTVAAAAWSVVQLRFVSGEEKQEMTNNRKDSLALIWLLRDRLIHSLFVDLFVS